MSPLYLPIRGSSFTPDLLFKPPKFCLGSMVEDIAWSVGPAGWHEADQRYCVRRAQA